MEQRYKLKPVDKRLVDVSVQVKKYIHNLLLECDRFLEMHTEEQDFENYDSVYNVYCGYFDEINLIIELALDPTYKGNEDKLLKVIDFIKDYIYAGKEGQFEKRNNFMESLEEAKTKGAEDSNFFNHMKNKINSTDWDSIE